MKVSNEFLKAKKDKGLNSLLVISRTDVGSTVHRTYLRLCVDVPVKYTNNKETVFIECDTTVNITNYSILEDRKPNSYICFQMSIYGARQMLTFLKHIKKDSDVRFEVIAYIADKCLSEINMVSHRLYGYINDEEYLLDCYTGSDSVASPVLK